MDRRRRDHPRRDWHPQWDQPNEDQRSSDESLSIWREQPQLGKQASVRNEPEFRQIDSVLLKMQSLLAGMKRGC